MERAGVRVLFPSAEPIAYRGSTTTAWYDRTELPPTAAEETTSVENSVGRLVVGGFSQGGGIALQLAYRGSPLGERPLGGALCAPP
ncbi:hypothetical protein EMIHUDRAFT_203543 [Emiliania huxleyi CCMP1516]|uniref:Phospholipase/carboxylesterase/thioesterase domain-containing protein n=2 Tax=Emiliania huxleyi TaxID=2903 RepID=A0A0D3K2V0_EMIH1|nr:hypothetical protein EMIHUDRAFT_203543 [Emiliania huxleyi CCMP1516]EOD30085.1 hypothetical protein EMIHUDRAFT_203543 [Emiliania huxleyi CCMP1516]|eukprot:XP_005782514.1 hypothetical protein EMIHUDRAFT_203543 [Emiliania huxleyi CCMP1516]